MAEYIEREALIENLRLFAPERYNNLVDMLIRKQATADVVEVVRCKDCRYLYFKDMAAYCPYRVGACIPSGFCSYGERGVQ